MTRVRHPVHRRSDFYPFVLLLLVLSGVTACNKYVAHPGVPERLVIFPPPPDTTRIQFLTQFSSSEDLQGGRGPVHRYLFGQEEPLGIIKPYGVTVAGTKVYICDTGIPGLIIMDLSERTFEYFVPDGKGQLQLPVNCYVDKEGTRYVADANRRQVVVFDREGKYLDAFGEAEHFKPTDLVLADQGIFVTSVEDHALYVYDREDHDLIGKIAGHEPGETGYIRQATNIAAAGDQLYVSDFGDFNVKRFSTDGEVTGVTGEYGDIPGTFTRPKGVALDRDSNLYVVDAAFENVQIFNKEGRLLMHFGGSYDGPGAMYLPAAVEISYENLSFYRDYVDPDFQLRYLIYVTNQYGPAKVNVYGFVEER